MTKDSTLIGKFSDDINFTSTFRVLPSGRRQRESKKYITTLNNFKMKIGSYYEIEGNESLDDDFCSTIDISNLQIVE